MSNLKELAERAAEMNTMTSDEFIELIVKAIETQKQQAEMMYKAYYGAVEMMRKLPMIYKEFASSRGIPVGQLTDSDKTQAIINHLIGE